jgi:hypothetical protein
MNCEGYESLQSWPNFRCNSGIYLEELKKTTISEPGASTKQQPTTRTFVYRWQREFVK